MQTPWSFLAGFNLFVLVMLGLTTSASSIASHTKVSNSREVSGVECILGIAARLSAFCFFIRHSGAGTPNPARSNS